MSTRSNGESRPAWLIDELSQAGRENVDPAHVAQYDDKEDASADAEVKLLVENGLDSRGAVVDLGAGTGQFAVAVARVCASVIAVDVSPVMLHRLRGKVASAGLTNVEIVEAGFLTYRHDRPPVDVVYSRWSLHHLADFWKVAALARVRSMLRPGGLFRLVDIAFSFDPDEIDARIELWRASLPIAAGPGEWVRADIDDHVRDEHSTFTWLLEPMLERSGFRVDDAVYSPDGVQAAYLARAV